MGLWLRGRGVAGISLPAKVFKAMVEIALLLPRGNGKGPDRSGLNAEAHKGRLRCNAETSWRRIASPPFKPRALPTRNSPAQSPAPVSSIRKQPANRVQ